MSDFTYVSTWQGWLYVAFVIDVYARQPDRDRLVHHPDRGSQYVSIRYTEPLAEAGIEPSAGSRGDSCDNALAETFNGLYKAELIRKRPATTILTARNGLVQRQPVLSFQRCGSSSSTRLAG